MNYIESENHRPGEPLRSWLARTPVLLLDAVFVIRMADAWVAIERLINTQTNSGEVAATSVQDMAIFGRLNSFCVARWYEPLVALTGPIPRMDPEVAQVVQEAARTHGLTPRRG